MITLPLLMSSLAIQPPQEATSVSPTPPAAVAEATEPADWREREQTLLQRIDELEVALRDEQERSLMRQQEWIEYMRVLGSFELPALPSPPAYIEDALREPPDLIALAAARELAVLRVRGKEIERVLSSLFLVEGIRRVDLLEVGLLHEFERRTWTGPVIARLLDDRGRMVGMLKASRMRVEASRAAHTVTLILEDGYESRGGVRRPFDGGLMVADPDGRGKMVASGGVRRMYLGTIDPDPWIKAVPELVDPEALEAVLDDGLWNLTTVRVDIVRLLRKAAGRGDPSWRLAAIGGVRGNDLRDVRFAEIDILSGRTKRVVFADSARIVARADGGIELRLEGGSVRRGDRVAPFLAGRYRIVLPRADAAAWKDALLPGLSPPPFTLAPRAGEDGGPGEKKERDSKSGPDGEDSGKGAKGEPPLR